MQRYINFVLQAEVSVLESRAYPDLPNASLHPSSINLFPSFHPAFLQSLFPCPFPDQYAHTIIVFPLTRCAQSIRNSIGDVYRTEGPTSVHMLCIAYCPWTRIAYTSHIPGPLERPNQRADALECILSVYHLIQSLRAFRRAYLYGCLVVRWFGRLACSVLEGMQTRRRRP